MRRAVVRAPSLGFRRLTDGAALGLAAAPILIFAWLAAHRLSYPYEVDWLEGGTVELVGRVLDGHGLYTAPSLGYVGFTYTPLFSYAAAAVAELTGPGFLPLRIVAVAGTFGVFAGLAWYVTLATGDRVAGALGAGLYAACYFAAGDSFDVGRNDSLFLALTLLCLCLGRRAGWGSGATGSWRAGVVVGAVGFLAFFTKQVGVVAVGPALAGLALARPWAGASALGVLVLGAGGSTLGLDWATGGWYRYFVLDELAGQPPQPFYRLGFWRFDLFENLRQASAVILLGLLVGLLELPRRLRGRLRLDSLRRSPLLYDVAAVGGLLVCAWISRIHSGGFDNVLAPAYAACAGMVAVALAALRRRGPLVGLLALGLLAIQIVPLEADPGQALATRADRRAGAALLTELRHLPHPVLILRHPWYGTAAGSGTFAQSDGITEVLRSTGPRGARTLERALTGSLDREHIQAVVLDEYEPPPPWMEPQLRREFREVPGRFLTPALRPPSDINTSPEHLWLRRCADPRPVRGELCASTVHMGR